MKTIFLAAGESTRTSPISNKNFLEFCGEPLILKILKNAQAGGLNNFIVVTSQENIAQVEKILKTHNFPAKVVAQKNLKQGMAGGVLAALEKVSDDESIFILGGNDFVDSKIYKEILSKSKNHDGALLAKRMKKYFPGGYFSIDSENKILSIIEKPGEGNEPSDLVNIVAHFFQKSGDLGEKLKKSVSEKADAYELSLDQLFKEKNFLAIEYNSFWHPIKYPWHILEISEKFLKLQKSSISKKAEISDRANLKGDNIVIEAGAKIYENATIVSPCFIGKNTVIGQNCLVRNSIIGSDCAIGFNSEIARSYLNSRASTHFAYIGDSVIDSGVNFGAFSCTANLRFDHSEIPVEIKGEKVNSFHKKLGAFVGQNAQIGAGSVIMPGKKIEVGEFVMKNF